MDRPTEVLTALAKGKDDVSVLVCISYQDSLSLAEYIEWLEEQNSEYILRADRAMYESDVATGLVNSFMRGHSSIE